MKMRNRRLPVILTGFGLGILSTVFLLACATSGTATGTKTNAGPSPNLSPYLVPVKIEWKQVSPRDIIVRINTKANLPAKISDGAVWVIGFDLDENKATGEKWSKIGGEVFISLKQKDGQWAASFKDQITGFSGPLSQPVRVTSNQVECPVPLQLLGYPSAFRWQVKVFEGDQSFQFPVSTRVVVRTDSDCPNMSCH